MKFSVEAKYFKLMTFGELAKFVDQARMVGAVDTNPVFAHVTMKSNIREIVVNTDKHVIADEVDG